jgi:aminoglycoside phosphotransferase (APT) family kinase protein
MRTHARFGAVVEVDVAQRSAELERFCQARWGATARIRDVRVLDGHGGETLAFTLEDHDGTRGLVARLAPAGVRRKGNTDVLRQVPLLEALSATDVPIAPLVAHTDDEQWFGTDALVQELVDGRPLHMFDAAQSIAPDADAGPFLKHAAHALAALHAVPVSGRLENWEPERTIADEIATWARLVDRMPEPEWAEAATRLQEELLASDPGGHHVGLFHGDYQTNNLLYTADATLLAVIDWELSGIGATGLDVGWLAMMHDPDCWGEPMSSDLRVRAAPDDVHRWYAEAAGADVPHFAWYMALSCFRYGVISAYNVRLHRTGRRVDEFNGLMASTVPVLLRRGTDLLT